MLFTRDAIVMDVTNLNKIWRWKWSSIAREPKNSGRVRLGRVRFAFEKNILGSGRIKNSPYESGSNKFIWWTE